MLSRTFASTVAAVATTLALAAAQDALAQAPANDDYLAAIALNAPGSPMPRDTVSSAATQTAGATLQADLLGPGGGGPPEPAACEQSPFAKTLWWRFFPDVDGHIKVQAVGYDATVAIVPFPATGSPLPQGFQCSNTRDDTIETLDAPVEAGSGYAVQVGGTAGAAGTLQVSFTYEPDRDGDGVLDDDDRCPSRAGSVNGCPPRIVARVDYGYDKSSRGVTLSRIRLLGAPAGASVDITCSRGCGHRRLRFRAPVTTLPGFADRFFPSGSEIVVRVTKSGHIGDYIRLRVAGRKVTTTHRCMAPGSSQPRRACP